MRARDPSPTTDDTLLEARLRAVFAANPIAAPAGWLGAAVVALAFWDERTAPTLTLWLLALGAVNALRVAAALAFARAESVRGQERRWAGVAVALNAASGLTWGIGGLWMSGVGEQHQITVLCCFIMGVAMGSIATVAYWPAHLAFHLPMFALLAAGFSRLDGPEGGYLAVGTVVTGIIVSLLGRSLGRSVVLAMRLAAENQSLAQRLIVQAAALEKVNHELSELSATDPLTGLANRRRFMSVLGLEWQKGIVAARPLSLLIIDVDNFKAYNDHHGHNAGDDCLVAIAGAIRGRIRDSVDVSARYGGEEFAIILPGSDAEAAAVVAERIRRAISDLASQPDAALAGPTSVSIGIASRVPDTADRIRDFIAAADDALYEAKRGGRDRIRVAEAGG